MVSARSLKDKFMMFERMKRENLKISSVTFNILIRACLIHGKITQSFMLYENEMQKFRVLPDAKTFEILLLGCSRFAVSASTLAFDLYSHLKSLNIQPTEKIMNEMMRAAILSQEKRKIHYIIDEMKLYDIVPDMIIFNTMIDGLGKQGQWPVIDKLLESMKTTFSLSSPTPLIANEHTYSSLIDSYCKFGLIDKATQLFEEVRANKVEKPLDPVLYSTMINCLLTNGKEEEAISLFEETKGRSIELSAHVYEKIICLLAIRSPWDSIQLLKNLYTDGIWVGTMKSYSHILEVYCENQQQDNIEQLAHHMASLQIPCSHVVRSNYPYIEQIFAKYDGPTARTPRKDNRAQKSEDEEDEEDDGLPYDYNIKITDKGENFY
eukprot:CAMPEP_0206189370 /NCGR_PEP_ID=MMETSP0166-20121206/4133_1 /ASSEMBLY_ACC=CAM_ASM_000260 /TAXON_ID=95228 /ORGANISM="Vannella robusta, Strain DIVA3 518/3/11/1/6" /LENGTH=378 /DNA_ID=CAMNT_0053605283 /DNA_START=1753 /DNA_END=2889 /DNA_ORIENTATION=+